MSDRFGNLETEKLVEILATSTQKLSHSLRNRELDDDYQLCKQLIHELQHEINNRVRPVGMRYSRDPSESRSHP
jgi:hypothetical protein